MLCIFGGPKGRSRVGVLPGFRPWSLVCLFLQAYSFFVVAKETNKNERNFGVPKRRHTRIAGFAAIIRNVFHRLGTLTRPLLKDDVHGEV